MTLVETEVAGAGFAAAVTGATALVAGAVALWWTGGSFRCTFVTVGSWWRCCTTAIDGWTGLA